MDNSSTLYALVLGVIQEVGEDERIIYKTISDSINYSHGSMARAVSYLDENKFIERDVIKGIGTEYKVLKTEGVPAWVVNLGRGCYRLETQPERAALLLEQHGDKQFERGFQVLFSELRGMFRSLLERSEADDSPEDDSEADDTGGAPVPNPV
jgi:hypothetical protein